MTSQERPSLDRLVDYSRRLPRSGERFDRAWSALHSSEHPALVKRAVETAERRADSALRALPRLTPAPPPTMSEHEVDIFGTTVFYRASTEPPEGPAMVHVHGFGISGTYLLPTAGLLADEYPTWVPDLPGYGRSDNPPRLLGIPALADALADFMDAVGVERATLVGNSLGTAVSAEFATRYRERTDRVVLVSPAGGLQNRPLPKALGQMVRDAPREPVGLVGVAAPDYLRFGLLDSLRLFREMIHFPAFERLISLDVPTLGVLGARDPLLPSGGRIHEVASQMRAHTSLVRLPGVAHAANFSHPEILAHVIRCFMRGEPITEYPGKPGAIQVAKRSLFEWPEPAES
jgi:pimeloyl-ACP methyl ester carboxylesterase